MINVELFLRYLDENHKPQRKPSSIMKQFIKLPFVAVSNLFLYLFSACLSTTSEFIEHSTLDVFVAHSKKWITKSSYETQKHETLKV